MALNKEDITCVGSVENNIRDNYEHLVHIPKQGITVNYIGASLNNITDLMCSWFSKIDKNQKINQNYVEAKLDSIENKIDNFGSILNVDLKSETKTTMESLLNKLDSFEISEVNGMNSPGDHQTPRLFYGTEDVMVLNTQTYNRTEYDNIVEILDYWRNLYKDPHLDVVERNQILKQIQETYLQNEDLLSHFHYEINMLEKEESSDDDTSHDGDMSIEENTSVVSVEKFSAEETLVGETSALGKRKAEDQDPDGIPPIHPDDPEYISDTDTSEYLYANDIKTEGDTSSTSEPAPSRRDDLNKYAIAQNGT